MPVEKKNNAMTVGNSIMNNKLFVALQEALHPFLKEKGFIYLPKWNQFRQPTATGFQAVILSMSHYEDLSLMEVHLGIRQDAVENLAYPFTDGLMGFRESSMTLVTPLAKLHGHAFQRFEVKKQTDVDRATKAVLDQLKNGGLSFLDKYARLEEMGHLYNRHPNHPLPLVHNQINRCLRGIVLARINQRNDFEEIAQTYRERLRALHAPQRAVDNFDRLRDYLRAYSQN